MWLADLFYDIADICDNIRVKCTQIAWWLYSHDWPSAFYNLFADIAGFFNDGYIWFRKVGDEINDWWDTISQHASDISTLWDYVYGWLKDKAVAAYDIASDAYDKARQAINDAAAGMWKAKAPGDIVFDDKQCTKCGKNFKVGDNLIYRITKIDKEGRPWAIPIHLECAGK